MRPFGKAKIHEKELEVYLKMFRRLLHRRAVANIEKLLKKSHAADLAVLFRHFTPFERATIFELIRKTDQLELFLKEIDTSIAGEILEPYSSEEIAHMLAPVSQDLQADILHLLPEEKASAILTLLKKEVTEELEELMAYPPESAGAIMSVDPFSFPDTATAGEAIKAIQSYENAATVFYLYITDEFNRLTGVVSLRQLVTAPEATKLNEIMTSDVVTVEPETDQEEVAKLVSKYNLLAIPVVDKNHTLLGIVMVDDVVDVIRQEATEDFLQMAGLGKDREILVKPVFETVKLRFPWLFATWVSGVVVSYITRAFEPVLMSTIALPAFIPVILGMGGNIGTQSSTIMVRGFATGRLQLGHAGKVIAKELWVGLTIGIIYGFLLAFIARFNFFQGTPPQLPFVVGAAICMSMFFATTIGTLIPILLRKMDVDPALAAGPFVTTSTDMIGITSYFLIAKMLLP